MGGGVLLRGTIPVDLDFVPWSIAASVVGAVALLHPHVLVQQVRLLVEPAVVERGITVEPAVVRVRALTRVRQSGNVLTPMPSSTTRSTCLARSEG